MWTKKVRDDGAARGACRQSKWAIHGWSWKTISRSSWRPGAGETRSLRIMATKPETLVHRIYEPDPEQMVKALSVLLKSAKGKEVAPVRVKATGDKSDVESR